VPPGQDLELLGSQETADGGIQEATQVPWPEGPLQTSGLQQSLPLLQEPPSGLHIGVVVVEVVLVDVLVVLLVDVLVEVVLVEKHVGGFGSRHLSVPPHPPQQSQGCSVRWRAAFSGLTQRVSASLRLHVPSRLGMWQILTVP
jgi:hypothetical protein